MRPLFRPGVVALVALAVIVGDVARVGAATGSSPVETARAAVDDVAVRWFAARSDAAAIEENLAAVEQRVSLAEADAAAIREVATTRALQIYKGDVTTLATVLGSDDALESARRIELINRVNADSDAAIDKLAAVAEDLRSEQADLRDARAHQAEVLAGLDAERSDLEAALEDAVAASRADAAQRSAAARTTSGRSRSFVDSPPGTAAGTPDSAETGPTGDSGGDDSAVGGSAVAPAPPTGEHPRHDEPFLSCTRARESGGNYAAVNPVGYYGAYQFAPLTWDTTASHAGRLDLVGVLPSVASRYDQDDLAWTLYEWQGNTPWGGRC